MYLQYRNKELRMNLQTTKDPETAKRFVQTKYEHWRIRYQIIADLVSGAGVDRLSAVQASTPPLVRWSTPQYDQRF